MSDEKKSLWSSVSRLLTHKKPPMTFAEAFDFFDKLPELTGLEANHKRGTCHIEAEADCHAAENLHHKPFKAWTFKPSPLSIVDGREHRSELQLMMPDASGERAYGFHVALALNVQMPDGQIKPLVFDRGLFDGPVELEDWRREIDGNRYQTQIKPYGKVPTEVHGLVGAYIPSDGSRNKLKDSELQSEIAKLKKEPCPHFQRLPSPLRAALSELEARPNIPLQTSKPFIDFHPH